jgi:hypothetical protein
MRLLPQRSAKRRLDRGARRRQAEPVEAMPTPMAAGIAKLDAKAESKAKR